MGIGGFEKYSRSGPEKKISKEHGKIGSGIFVGFLLIRLIFKSQKNAPMNRDWHMIMEKLDEYRTPSPRPDYIIPRGETALFDAQLENRRS